MEEFRRIAKMEEAEADVQAVPQSMRSAVLQTVAVARDTMHEVCVTCGACIVTTTIS